ncbi:LytR/AlgR family response regulator transcription factor [Anaeromicropila herbilytica]|uniref:Stage 0 sporulation protein A homolog n=1 Tax=Anaeromicropila herbilytica TaxID=2785025 RepID=A0A7R7EQA5_9FIRM|nr:LytTR family DNA-binding domain-containing protein [Anaeromicropila herbilytica]BCN32780.1 DNA-binding response regulator [Anaeromicropila herbilytica]
MIHIAVCDDDSIFKDYLLELIKRWSKSTDNKVSIQQFDDGAKFVDYLCISQTEFDIILLDMQMKELGGIDTAQVIRKRNNKVIIIFITSHIDMVLHAFEVKAYRYLMKDTIEKELPMVLTKAIEEIQYERKNMFSFSFQGKERLISLQDIVYFESNKRTILVHLKDKVLSYYGKLNEVELEVSDYEFIRIHQSYIINLKYVEEIRGYDLMLEQGIRLPISKSKIKEVNRAFTWSLR